MSFMEMTPTERMIVLVIIAVILLLFFVVDRVNKWKNKKNKK